MVYVNRGDFIAWTQGDLLDRRADGTCLVGDDAAHEVAQRALDEGEIIGLLVDGQLFSTMRLEPDGYCETKGGAP